MDLFFETQSGSTFSIEVGYWDTVLEIKQKIEKYQRIPVSEQTLLFQGDVPLEDDLDIEQCNIFHNSRLQVVVSPFPNSDQVLQTKQSPVSPNPTGDIIYGQDLPLTTEEIITPVLLTEKSPPLKPEEQVINDQDLPVTVQALQTEQSPPPHSVKEITNIQDSPVERRRKEKVPNRIEAGRSKNDQVLQTEQSPPSNSVKEITNIQEAAVKVSSNNNTTQVLQTEKSPPKEIINFTDPPWKPVKVKIINNNNSDQVLQTEQSPPSESVKERMTVYVLPYSGESKAASKIPVVVNPMEKVASLRKELVKIQQRGQLNLPQEGYFFKHNQSKLREDETFWCSGVENGNTIEISPGHLPRGSVTHTS